MADMEIHWREESVRAANAVWFVGVEAGAVAVVAPPGVSISRREERADMGGGRTSGWLWAVWRRSAPREWPMIDEECPTEIRGIDTAEALHLLGEGFRESIWHCLWGQLQIARQVGSTRLGTVPAEELARAGAQSVAWLQRELTHVFPDRAELFDNGATFEPATPRCGHFTGLSPAGHRDPEGCPLCQANQVRSEFTLARSFQSSWNWLASLGTGELPEKSDEMRAGAFALPIAANAISRSIVRHALEGPISAGPGLEYQVGPAGWDGLHVSSIAERWLRKAPGGPFPLEDDDEEGPVKTLLDGWCPGIVHALAREPLTFDELERAVGLRRRALRKRVAAMREVGLLERRVDVDSDTRYAATEWLREAIAPLAAAARNELRHPRPETVPIDALDVEAAFLLTLPLLALPGDIAGACRLSVELAGQPVAIARAGVTALAEAGRVRVLTPEEAPAEPDARASATAEEWLDTVIEPDASRVRTSGDRRLARLLLKALHQRLFAVE